jgi:hypothetical protein
LPTEGEDAPVAAVASELELFERQVRKPLHEVVLLVRRKEIRLISEPFGQGRASLEKIGLAEVHGSIRSPVSQ